MNAKAHREMLSISVTPVNLYSAMTAERLSGLATISSGSDEPFAEPGSEEAAAKSGKWPISVETTSHLLVRALGTASTPADQLRPVAPLEGGRSLIFLGRLYLGEGGGKPRFRADEPGQHPEVVTTHGQHTAVEILALDLDRAQEALEDLTLCATYVVQAGEIDGDVLR